MHVDVKGVAPKRFLPTIGEADEEGDEESASVYHSRDSIILQRKVEIPEPIARNT